MTDIAFLLGDFIIYWSRLVVIPGIVAGGVFVFSLRYMTKVKKQAVILWLILTVILSFFLSRMFYFYCHTAQYHSFGDILRNPFDSRHCVAGLVFGTLISALAVKFAGYESSTRKLLDTTFPGVILALAMIRGSYLFSNTYHSTIAIRSTLWQRIPFAVKTTDAAGNISFVFAPFLVSFILLLSAAFLFVLFVRKKIQKPGNFFLLLFLVLALSEMVLESTRADALKLHFLLLQSLNKYVSFISFPMFVFGLCVLAIFLFNYLKITKYIKRRKSLRLLIIFTFGFISFGICEFLAQRYTSIEALFHWLQTAFAVLMAVSIIQISWWRKLLMLRQQKKHSEKRN